MLPRRSLRLFANPSNLIRHRVLPALVGLIVIFFIYDLFVIRQIRCTLDDGSCPENISEKLKTYLGESAIFINQKNLSSSISSLYPTEEVSVGFNLFNTLSVTLVANKLYYNAKAYLVQEIPVIGMDLVSDSTISANWPKPTTDIESFIIGKDGLNFDLWKNGNMTPSATAEAKIIYIFKQKPSQESVVSLFKLIQIISRYLDFTNLYVVEDRVFLRQTNQPDIIVYVSFDDGQLIEALQSFTYLATIKKDAKVVDLRFKNPIIR